VEESEVSAHGSAVASSLKRTQWRTPGASGSTQ
jgi:hypothetical protein